MIIKLEDLSHIYNQGHPNEVYALRDINVELNSEDFIGIIGHTGSGKSTLVQHLNGLLKPSKGRIIVDGIDINSDSPKAREKRQSIGLVFQYPEHQLFEETVFKDISFGPKNQGLSEEEINSRVRKAMEDVGLGEELAEKSPFELSGGQRRRVAIAGVIAMDPDFLILDEPTAGLDPHGREEILSLVKTFHKEGKGIIFISHSMEDMARLATRILVMENGTLYKNASPKEVFANKDDLEKHGLSQPQITKFMSELNKKYPQIRKDILTVKEARDEINRVLGGQNV